MLSESSESRIRIIEAAAQEFADRGFAGVRMEHVARRAQLNKSLVYRYFGDKEGLFKATLSHFFREREAHLEKLPDTLPEILVGWSRKQHNEASFIRLVVREALEDDGSEPVEAKSRRAYYQKQIEMLRALQRRGAVDPTLDPDMLFFALLMITIGPVVLPQIARLSASRSAKSFRNRWERFLVGFARTLAGPKSR